jgi:hypothetical protein
LRRANSGAKQGFVYSLQYPHLTSKLDLNLKNKLVKCYVWSTALYGAETGHCGKQMRHTWEVLKCGAGEGWRRSVGPIVWEMN